MMSADHRGMVIHTAACLGLAIVGKGSALELLTQKEPDAARSPRPRATPGPKFWPSIFLGLKRAGRAKTTRLDQPILP
jgi:hypothetical protein